MPVVCNDRCPGYVPQLQFINKVVYIPGEVQRLSHGPDCPSDHRDSPVLLQGHRYPCCAGRASSTGAVVEETVALSQLQLLRNSPDVVSIPVVVQRQFPMVLRTIEIPQFPFDKVIDVPVVQVV